MALAPVYGNTTRRPNLQLVPRPMGVAAPAPVAAPMAVGRPTLGLPTPGAPVAGAAPKNPNDINSYTSVQDYINHLLGQGGAAGALGPNYLRNLLRRRAIGTYGNQGRRSSTMAGLYGLDPAQARQAMLENDQSANAGLSSALNEADLAGASNYQQLLQSLLGSRFGQENAYKQAEAEKAANRGNFGSFLGQAVGTVLPGIGAGVGERIGRKK